MNKEGVTCFCLKKHEKKRKTVAQAFLSLKFIKCPIYVLPYLTSHKGNLNCFLANCANIWQCAI